MDHVKKLIALLCFASCASAQVVYYPVSTIPPQIAAHSFPCNSTAGTLEPTQCTALDGIPIGGVTPAAGTFTVLTGTSGTLAGLTGLGIRDTSAAFDVTLAAVSSTALSAGRTLTFDLKNVAHTLAFNSTANTITFPNTASYTLIGSGDSGTVTNAMLAGSITLANHATQATNTVVGNATSGSAAPTALAVGTCSTSASALIWTTNTGFGCNTAINAATLGGATFAAPGAIGGGTAAAGTFTSLNTSALSTFGFGITFSGNATIPTVGFYSTGSNLLQAATNGVKHWQIDTNGKMLVYDGIIDNGTTKFTAAGTGCTVGTTVGGAATGTFTLAAGPCTAVAITMGGATGSTSNTGWSCQAHDRTAPTILIGGEASSTTTTATITIPAGAGTSDVISFSCTGY